MELNDRAIEELKVADFEFSQIYAPNYPRNLVQYQDEMKVNNN